MNYLTIKALHIIFVVSWFAGLFYLPRLFVYHTEANQRLEAERKVLQEQFSKMESILMRAIMMPAMILTIVFGIWMLYLVPTYLQEGWMQLKLLFVVCLLIYHFFCQKMIGEMKLGKFRFSSFQLRLYNEIATVFLFAIVFLVVLKNSIDWIWGVLGLLAFAVLIMSAVKIIKTIRDKS